MPNIKLPRLIVNSILKHAQETPQACGFLTAKDGKIKQCYRALRHELTQTHIQPILNKLQHELFAIYQTSAQGPMSPSWPEAYCLEVSINTKGVLELNAYQHSPQGLQSLAVELEESF